ncbi:hypothetical protein Cfor_08598 [Coptotermes formosanus]|uniref:Uncharacterized protein n=1 Tax=Coptotermes formosanus TaxID=36987 RepID=A0A6L2PUU1_COPFO|nr:hypothetical protein Cfor_08598 [Coptotermes formosanus]
MIAHTTALNLQAEEVEREKKLILEGKIPVKEASKELKEHPVFKISQLTKHIIEEKKAKVKPPAPVPRPCCFGNVDEPAPVLSSITERRCSDLSVTLHNDSDVTHSVVFKREENDRLKYECPLVRKLRELQHVLCCEKFKKDSIGRPVHRVAPVVNTCRTLLNV